MRACRWAAALLLAGLPLQAQFPPRKELTKAPKYVEGAKPVFRAFSEAQLRSEIRIVPARSYAMFGYNTPEVRIQLPRCANSAYASIEFGTATLLDAKGAEVPFELEEGGYEASKYSDEIRFSPKEGEGILAFAQVRGHVKVKYPLSVTTLSATKAKPGPAALAVKLDGPFVAFAEEEAKLPDAAFSELHPARAYDAAGRQLEAFSYSESGYDDSGAYLKRMAFCGEVARLELDSIEGWAELELDYDLKPAPLLPAGKEGEDPEAKP